MMTNAIVVATPKHPTTLLLQQSDAILQLKKKMKPGVHYGPPYPGSKKETLLKPGGEWLARKFGLRPEFIEIERQMSIDTADLSRSVIFYRYRCHMIDIETGLVVGEAIGSCNSLEDKYRWRWVPLHEIPEDLDSTKLKKRGGKIIEFTFSVNDAKTEGQYGKPAEYWQQFKDAIEAGTARSVKKSTKDGREFDAWEIDSTVYRIPIENPLDLVNTLDKMAQKRASLSCVIAATGASSYFAPGDAEVTDIYITEDDSDIIEAEFTETDEEETTGGEVSTEAARQTLGQGQSEQRRVGGQPETKKTWYTKEAKISMEKWLWEKHGLTSDEGLKLVGKKDWGEFTDGKAACAAVVEKSSNPPIPKNPIKTIWTDDEVRAFNERIWDTFGTGPADFLAALQIDKWNGPSAKLIAVTWQEVVNVAVANGWGMIARSVVYNGKYLEFQTPVHIRAYGRSTAFKTLVGEDYYTANDFEAMTKRDEPYPIKPLALKWEKKDSYFIVVEAKPIGQQEAPAEEPPTEEKELDGDELLDEFFGPPVD